MIRGTCNFISSLAAPAAFGALTGLGLEIVCGSGTHVALADRPAVRLAAVFAGVDFLASRVVSEKLVDAAFSMAEPAAYGALTGLLLEIVFKRNPELLVNRPSVRAAAAFASANFLWNSPMPETAFGAVGGLVMRQVKNKIMGWIQSNSESPAFRNELWGDLKAIGFGATAMFIAGVAFRVILERD